MAIAIFAVSGAFTVVATGEALGEDDRIDIGGIEHIVVDGQHVILVRLNSTSQETLTASGLLSVVDAGGLELVRVNVETGRLEPDGASVLAVPLREPLDAGVYSVSLVLSVDPDGAPVHSGPRQIRVDPVSSVQPGPSPGTGPTGTMLPDGVDGRFPAWIFLLVGLVLVVFGVTVRRESSRKRSLRTVPHVAMVRKVTLDRRPPRRPATIKPLRPPGGRTRE